MSADKSPDLDKFVKHIVDAFADVHVPAAPSVQETLDRVVHASEIADNDVPHGRFTPTTSRHFGLSRRQRLALGGIGFSSAAAILILFLTVNSGRDLSAMERMTRELRAVQSYSYRISSTAEFVDEKTKHPVAILESGRIYWQAPSAFRDERTIVRVDKVPADGVPAEEVLEDFVDVSPAEKPGIFLDRKRKTFVHTPKLRVSATGSVTYPMDVLRLIREKSGTVTRDLGSKTIQGRAARGYIIALDGARDGVPIEPQEVWVDAETDLPLEFGHETRNKEGTSVVRFTDFRWNVDLDPQLFDATPPADCTDVTPPTGEDAPPQIADALKLYATLCGRYPQVDSRVGTFDAAAIHDEMLRAAGFTGPAIRAWKQQQKYRDIEDASIALKEVSRVLRNRYHAGYDGLHVGQADSEKVLLWWRQTETDGLRVFFGDLRTRVISDAEGKKYGLDNWLER
jgi:outer membrane lipoprotein-sorting protein